MKRHGWRVILGLCVVAWLGGFAEAYESKGVGVVTALQGRATVTHDNKLQESLKFRSDLFWRDTVDTEKESLTRILLQGKSSITVRELSRLELREDIGPAGQRRWITELTSGKIRASVSRTLMGPNEEVELRTPNAVAGVRGSEAIMAYAEGRTEFIGVDGRFEVTNPQDPTRARVTVGELERTFLLGANPPTLPEKLTTDQIRQAVRDVRVTRASHQQTRVASSAQNQMTTRASNDFNKVAPPDQAVQVPGRQAASPTLTTATQAAVTQTNLATTQAIASQSVVAPVTKLTPANYDINLTIQTIGATYLLSTFVEQARGTLTGSRTGFMPGSITGDYSFTSNTQGFHPAEASSTDTNTLKITGRITGFSGQATTGNLSMNVYESGKLVGTTDGTLKVFPDGSSEYRTSSGKVYSFRTGAQDGVVTSGLVNMSKPK
jgi:hypothetical protein